MKGLRDLMILIATSHRSSCRGEGEGEREREKEEGMREGEGWRERE
jgi:hypothetical protein